MSREHLSGPLRARIRVPAALEVGTAPSVPASDGTRSPARSPKHTAAPTPVPATDVDDPRPPLRTGRPIRSRSLGGGFHRRSGAGIRDRYSHRTADPTGPAAAFASSGWRVAARGIERADGGSARRPAAVDHLGPGHRDGQAHRDHEVARDAGLLLRLSLTLATRLQLSGTSPTAHWCSRCCRVARASVGRRRTRECRSRS